MVGVYTTSSGKKVDMRKLMLENETVIAVGNAGTNARGDLVSGGKIIKTREQLMQEQYNLSTNNLQRNIPVGADDGYDFQPQAIPDDPSVVFIEPASRPVQPVDTSVGVRTIPPSNNIPAEAQLNHTVVTEPTPAPVLNNNVPPVRRPSTPVPTTQFQQTVYPPAETNTAVPAASERVELPATDVHAPAAPINFNNLYDALQNTVEQNTIAPPPVDNETRGGLASAVNRSAELAARLANQRKRI